jgi:hypothetical protein
MDAHEIYTHYLSAYTVTRLSTVGVGHYQDSPTPSDDDNEEIALAFALGVDDGADARCPRDRQDVLSLVRSGLVGREYDE